MSISSYTFTNRWDATLYVPIGSKTAYEAANYWKEFKEIVEEGTSGINLIKAREPVDVYTLDGQKIRSKVTDTSDLSKGVYIIRGKKVVVR